MFFVDVRQPRRARQPRLSVPSPWPFHEAGQGEGTGGEGKRGGAYLSMGGDVDVGVLAWVEELHDGHEVRLCDGDAASGGGAVGDVQEES